VVAHVLIDHARIRWLAHQIATEAPPIAMLQLLGNQLAEHIRREERELFPLIESARCQKQNWRGSCACSPDRPPCSSCRSAIIRAIRVRGYRFVTVNQCL
jgi:hypothetical protein